MNVTSLLNTGHTRQERSDRIAGSPNHSSSAGTTASTAVHTPTPTPSPESAPPQSKMTQSRSPPKLCRTPWEGDHGNPFSLPLNLAVNTKSIPITTTTGPSFYDESPVDAPRQPSPRLHKFSDSTGSSLSSYTSSSTSSLSHSRISSLSTVGETMSWPVNVPDLSELLNTAAPGLTEKAEEEPYSPSSPTPVEPSHEPPPPIDTGQTNPEQTYTGSAEPGDAEVEHTGNGSRNFGHVTSDSDPGHADIGWIDHQVSSDPSENEESGKGHDDAQTDPGNLDPGHRFGHEQASNRHDEGHIVDGTLSNAQQFTNDQPSDGHNNRPTNTTPLDAGPPDTTQQFGYDQYGNGRNNGRADTGLLDNAQQFRYDQPGSGHNKRRSEAGTWSTGQQFSRPLSPSDVVMIRRGAGGSSYTGSPPTTSPIESQQNAESYYLGQTEVSASRTHKRAVSAPDFPALRGPDPLTAYGRDVPTTYAREMPPAYGQDTKPTYGRDVESAYGKEPAYGQDPAYGRDMQPNLGRAMPNPPGANFSASGTASHPRLQTIHEPTYSEPQTQVSQAEESEDDDDDDDLQKKTALTLAPKSVLDNLDAEPRCMFVKDCRTGSQLRKAISHIFGRNKICTRQIPDNIWVHFCRKHYQRCRYRNVQEYAKLQCQLVIKQIQRVQAWSDRNQVRDALGVVSGWTLSVRKREQRRMQTKNDGYDGVVIGQKRPYPGFEGLGMEAEADNRYKDPHALPNWLLEKCDRNYTTGQIIEIFKQIEEELNEDRLRQIPDIEVLPSITHDPNAEIQYKRYEKRKMVEAALMQNQSHRRVQSTGSQWYGLGSGSSQSYTGSSGPGFWSSSEGMPGTGYQVENLKRQRVGEFESTFQPRTQMPDIPLRSESRTVPSIWRPGPSTGSYLPAPVAQRPGTQSTAQQLESSTTTVFNDPLRSSHYRSQSDASSFRQLPPVGSDPQASRFTSINTPSWSTPNYAQRSSSSYHQQSPARQGGAYGSGPDTQHSQGQTFGTGAGGQQYPRNNYGTVTSGQSSSYNDFPPRQQHPSFSSGPTSYYQDSAAAAPPLASRQGHARHQSTPAISHTSQQMYESSSGFHSTVVPEGYPPDNQTYGQGRQLAFTSGQSKEDLDA